MNRMFSCVDKQGIYMHVCEYNYVIRKLSLYNVYMRSKLLFMPVDGVLS